MRTDATVEDLNRSDTWVVGARIDGAVHRAAAVICAAGPQRVASQREVGDGPLVGEVDAEPEPAADVSRNVDEYMAEAVAAKHTNDT